MNFHKSIAVKYGVDCAVFINHIHYWVKVNQYNNQNYFDGKYWIYNTLDAFCLTFPFWSKRQLRVIIDKLRSKNILLTGQYHKDVRNRVLYYTLCDSLMIELDLYNDGLSLNNSSEFGLFQSVKNGKSTNVKNDISTNVKNDKCIIGTNNNTNNKTRALSVFDLNLNDNELLVWLIQNHFSKWKVFESQYSNLIEEKKYFADVFCATAMQRGLIKDPDQVLSFLLVWAKGWIQNNKKVKK